jgi:RecA-family ATPase
VCVCARVCVSFVCSVLMLKFLSKHSRTSRLKHSHSSRSSRLSGPSLATHLLNQASKRTEARLDTDVLVDIVTLALHLSIRIAQIEGSIPAQTHNVETRLRFHFLIVNMDR